MKVQFGHESAYYKFYGFLIGRGHGNSAELFMSDYLDSGKADPTLALKTVAMDNCLSDFLSAACVFNRYQEPTVEEQLAEANEILSELAVSVQSFRRWHADYQATQEMGTLKSWISQDKSSFDRVFEKYDLIKRFDLWSE